MPAGGFQVTRAESTNAAAPVASGAGGGVAGATRAVTGSIGQDAGRRPVGRGDGGIAVATRRGGRRSGVVAAAMGGGVDWGAPVAGVGVVVLVAACGAGGGVLPAA